MRRLRLVLSLSVAVLALAAPATAHIIVVPASGESHWIGGGPLPAQAQGAALLASPIGLLPPSHATGLPHGCMMLMANPSMAIFLAPPSFTGCQHGT